MEEERDRVARLNTFERTARAWHAQARKDREWSAGYAEKVMRDLELHIFPWNGALAMEAISTCRTTSHELGGDFGFVGRPRRLRIDQTWYRVGLLFFIAVCHHRPEAWRSHNADVGQMHMYCSYARENWTLPDENRPISTDESWGLIHLERLTGTITPVSCEKTQHPPYLTCL